MHPTISALKNPTDSKYRRYLQTAKYMLTLQGDKNKALQYDNLNSGILEARC